MDGGLYPKIQRKSISGQNNERLTAPTSNWRGRGNRKFCIFKQPFVTPKIDEVVYLNDNDQVFSQWWKEIR